MIGYSEVDFDPSNIRKSDMNKLADAIEEYVELFEELMIVPKEISKQEEAEIRFGLAETKKLIKKLRKGDTSVFKDYDEWNYLR